MAGLIPFNKRRPSWLTGEFADFHNMVDDFFSEGWPFRRSLAGDTFKLDVHDNGNEYVIEAELPGVAKNELTLSLDDGKLEIVVVKEEAKEDKDKNYLHKERSSVSMSRCIYLADATEKNVKAKLEDGILHINIPKREKPDKAVNIDID